MANQNFRVKHGLEVSGNTLVTGITTAGSLETAVGTISRLSGTHISISGIASLPTLDTTFGEINYLSGVNLDYSGIASVTRLEATNAFIGVAATITTIDVTNGTIDVLSGTDINISGIATANTFNGDLIGDVVGNLTGVASTATKLETTRDFSVSGDVTTASAVSFNGTGNVDLSVTLSNTFDANTSGIVTASQLSTGASGTGVNISADTISGPATLTLDPSGVGDNTGVVVIKGDLQVDGTQTIVNSTVVSVDDKNLLLGSGAANDAAADGGGITLESAEGNKTLNWIDATDSWTSSENFDLASGKTYKIAGNEVLSSSLLTITNINASGIVTATGGFIGTVTGNVTGNLDGIADSASKLFTSRDFSLTGDVATLSAGSFDGTSNLNLVTRLSNTFSANTTGIITAFKFDSNNLNVSGMATISQIHLGGLSPDGSTFGISNYVPVANGSGGWSWQPIAAAGGGSLDGISVLEEGSSVGAAGSIISVNFTGDNVTATATGTAATINFSDSPTYQNIVSIESSDETSGRLDLYCEVGNAHYTRLQAAPHSTYSGNATVILPVIDGTMIVGGTNSNTVDITTSGDITADSFVKSGGTSSEFLKADGSVDTSTYLTTFTETDPVVAAINGIVKSNGTTIAAAVAGTDYLAPAGDGSSLTGIVTSITAGSGISIDQSTGNVTISGSVVGSIDDLSDVDTSSVAPSEGQTLLWDSANSKWEPGTVSGLPSVNAIIPVALGIVTSTSGSGVGVTWGNWNSGNYTLDFTFDVQQPDANYAVITDSEKFDDRFVGISNKTTTGFRAEFYDNSISRTPSTEDPYTILIYGSDPRSNVAVSVASAQIQNGGTSVGVSSIFNFGTNLTPTISNGVVTIDGPDLSSYLTTYTETQTLDDVLTLGNTSSTGIQVGISTIGNQLSITSSDGTVGRLDLYCEVGNAHYTRLQAAPHSTYSGNATVVVPNSSGTLLLTDGDGSALTGIVTSIVAGTNITVSNTGGTYTINSTATGGGGGIAEVSADTTPQLGGDLDLNSKNITGTGNINITGSLQVSGISTFQSDIYLGNSDKIILGGGSDLQIYNDGANSYIVDNGVGDLFIRGTAAIVFENAAGDEAYAKFNVDGSTELYFDSVKKLETAGGGINVTGIVTATDFNSTSDINLKENIRLIEDPISKVMSIRGVNFEWKENSETSAGIVAQEVEKIMPELVKDTGDKKTVNYNGLIGLLIEVVKEQQKQIDDLRRKL